MTIGSELSRIDGGGPRSPAGSAPQSRRSEIRAAVAAVGLHAVGQVRPCPHPRPFARQGVAFPALRAGHDVAQRAPLRRAQVAVVDGVVGRKRDEVGSGAGGERMWTARWIWVVGRIVKK